MTGGKGTGTRTRDTQTSVTERAREGTGMTEVRGAIGAKEEKEVIERENIVNALRPAVVGVVTIHGSKMNPELPGK